jgi:uncharacterized protein (DUF433 family)
MSDKIIKTDSICDGQPVIRDTRTSVLSIVNYMEIYGDVDAILKALPHVTHEDIEAALLYYRQHTDEIETYRREEDASETWDLPNTYTRDIG